MIFNLVVDFMKKIMVLLLLCAASLGTYAQEKGDKLLSTSVGVNLTRAKLYQDDKAIQKFDPELTLNLSLGIHGFVANNFRFGLEGACTLKKGSEGDFYQRTKSALLGPVFAYYVKLADKFHYVPQLGVYYIHTNFTSKSNITGDYVMYGSSYELEKNGIGFEIQPLRFEVRPNKHLGLSMGVFNISFIDLIQKNENQYKTTGFVFDLGINPEVGMQIYF